MATISNSDQENKELVVENVNQSARDMMIEFGLDIGVATFFADPEKAIDFNGLQSVGEMEGKQGNNATASSSSNSASGSTGGSIVGFVDTKAIAHKMNDIRQDPAMEIPEGELTNESKEKIEKKAQRSQEIAEQDRESGRE